MDEQQQRTTQDRRLMRNELDYLQSTTDTVWGRAEIVPELKKKLGESIGRWKPLVDDKGNIVIDPKTKEPKLVLSAELDDLWSLLGFYTRDLRLGNLDPKKGEVEYCQYYLDLAHDYLQFSQENKGHGMVLPFLICLSRVATVLELSQSKNGFFRRRNNTITSEHIEGNFEPEKKNLFGKVKGGGN